jgi:trehalose 6-phosphate synthase/phosphatase
VKGLTDGAAAEALLSAMARRGDAPEFVLCVGGDESVFEALVDDDGKLPAGARVFTCTVGRAPSKAAFYLDEPQDVVAVLRGLLNICGHPSRRLPDAAAAAPAARGPHSRRPSLFEIASAW